MASLASIELGLPQTWLPDETLFSLCSRYHAASGNRLPSTTCRALFGHPTQGSAHDFPARLGDFLSVAGPALGTAESIVEDRTVLPLYLRFTNESLAEKVINAASLNSSGRLKFQLGLLTSRFRANHPLKACPACMAEDAIEHATAYWHREHQVPGVWLCRRHGCRLLASDLKATGVYRFHWVLPSSSQFPPPPPAPPSASAARLAYMTINAIAKPGLRLSPQSLRLAYRAALRNRGLLGHSGQYLRHAAAGRSYAAFVAPLMALEQLDGLPTSDDAAGTEIARLIGPVRSGIHPLRHLALAAWLFPTFDEFLEVHNTVAIQALEAEPYDAPTEPSFKVNGDDGRRRRFLDLIAARRSVSSAAREIGIDTTTGMVWAAASGIATPRRPKVMNDDLRAQLVTLLRKGVGKSDAAEYARVSLQTITTLLRTEVGLHQVWKQAVFANAQRRSRRKWERFTAANPLSGVKAARLAEPAAYAWLYRNDRDWLTARTDTMARVAREPCSRLDWDARDRQLADGVRQVALQLAEANAGHQIKLFQLYQKLPQLKAKLFKLDRLPLTRAAIFDVLGRFAHG
jgi:hypothetical protein